MAQTYTATTGPNRRPIVDLDAGTTMPRIAQVALVALALLAVAAAPGRQPGATAPAPVQPEALTVPALRSPWSTVAGPLGPELPIGPVPAISALAPLHVAAGARSVPPTGTTDDRD